MRATRLDLHRVRAVWGEVTVLVLLCGITVTEVITGAAAVKGAPRLLPSVQGVGDLAVGEVASVPIRVENPGPGVLTARMVSTCECLWFPEPAVYVEPHGDATVVAVVSAKDRRGRNEVFGQLIGADGTAYSMVRIDFTGVDPFAVSLVAARGDGAGRELEYVLEYRGKSPPAELWAMPESPGRLQADLRRTGPRAWTVRALRAGGDLGHETIRVYAGETELQSIQIGEG